MTHYRVVTLDNGQRSETQAWGHDHSPNVETATAERVEVIKGPASVLYGSDALGGVINVVAPPVPDALDGPRFVAGAPARSTATTSAAPTARWPSRAPPAGSARAARSWPARAATCAPPGASSPHQQPRRLHRGRPRLPRRVGRGVGPATPGATSASRSSTTRSRTRRTRLPAHRHAPRERRGQLPVGAARLQVNGGYEQNLRREFAGLEAARPDLGLFVRNWTGFAHLHHAPRGPVAGTLGVSAMTSRFANRGDETLIPDSDTRTAGVYAFEQAELGRWRATAGARYDWRALATAGNADIGVPAQRRTFGALTGSAGLLYRLASPVSLVANVARGFRAPAAPDLFANGFHEGTRAFERGDPTLRVETSLNTDLGVRVNAASLTAEATGFVNRVADYIYLRPFGVGGAAFDSLQVVQGGARLVGAEGRVAYRPARAVTLQLSGDYVRGQNTTAGVPLTFIPPLRLLYGVRVDGDGRPGPLGTAYVTVSAETNARQTRLDPRDVGTPGYTLGHLGAGLAMPGPRGPVTVDLSVRNALDARYRGFLSRYKESALGPGRAVVLRVSTPL
jgi:iron complex outermembrane receptor protein